MTENAGFLNDLDLENVEENQNFIADGKYPATIVKSETMTPNSGKNKGFLSWTIDFKINASSSVHPGKVKREFLTVGDTGDAEKNETNKSFIKRRTKSLGISDERAKTLKPGDVLALDVWMTIQNKGGYSNIDKIELRDASTGESLDANVSSASAVSGITDL